MQVEGAPRHERVVEAGVRALVGGLPEITVRMSPMADDSLAETRARSSEGIAMAAIIRQH